MRISNEMQKAFIDEMEKISAKKKPGLGDMAYYSEKRAGFLSNVGKAISSGAADAGGALNTMIAHPVQGVAKGLQVTGGQLRDSVSQMRTGPLGALKGAFLPGMMALGLYSGVKGLRGDEDPMGMGRGKAERYGDFIGSQFGGLVGAGHGLTGNIVAGVAGQKAGAAIGRVVDKVRGHKPPPDADRSVRAHIYNTVSPVPVRASRRQAVAPPTPSAVGDHTA